MDFSPEDIKKLPKQLQIPLMISKLVHHAITSVVSIQCILHLCPGRKEEVLKYLLSDYSIVSKSLPNLKEAFDVVEDDDTTAKARDQAIGKYMRNLVLDAQSAVDAYLTGHSDEENSAH